MPSSKEGGGDSIVTTGQSKPPPNNNTTTTQGTTNTSTTEENNRQGQGSGVAMEEDGGVEDKDVKMKETASRIQETPKKHVNNNNGDEDDTKQAAVVYAVPKIEIKEVYGTDSLTNCLTKCEKCKLSAVIRVEVNGKVFILCNDHLELER